MMTRFMGFLAQNSKNFIRADEHWKWKGYGDWLSMNADTPSDFIGTAFYAHCAALMAKIARVLDAAMRRASMTSFTTTSAVRL
jgi:alpha-L-rhamnosidase